METNMYSKALQKSRARMWLSIALGFASGAAVIFGVVFAALGAFLIGLGIVGHLRLAQKQKRMAAYGVDEAAKEQFEAEYADTHLLNAAGRPSVWNKDAGKPNAALTQNWFFCQQVTNTALMPLREVVWYYKHIYRDGGARNWVMIHFSDGSTFKVFCGDQSIISSTDITATWLGTLQKLCPQALAGYSDKRYAAYAKDRIGFTAKVRQGSADFDA